MTFLRDHWRLCAELVLLLALAGTTWSAFHREPAPAVHEVLDEHKADDKKADTEQHADVGGWTATTYYFGAGDKHPAGSPEGQGTTASSVAPAVPDTGHLVEMVVERHDPTVIDTHAITQEHATEDRHLDLTVTPQAAPGWALQVGFEDVLAARTLRLAARRRLFGPLWVELSAMPMQRSLGVAVAVQW